MRNVTPTATIGNSGPINEGNSATVSLSNPSDPSSADTAAGFHYSFALTQAALATSYAAAADGSSKSFAFGDNGTPTVYARIFDKDGGYREYSTAITVNNVAPTIVSVIGPRRMYGQLAAFVGTFTDPGWPDTHAATWEVLQGGATVAGPTTVDPTGSPATFTFTPRPPACTRCG